MGQHDSDRAKQKHDHVQPLRAMEDRFEKFAVTQTRSLSLLDMLDPSQESDTVIAPSGIRNDEISQLDHLPVLSEDPSPELHRRVEYLERTTHGALQGISNRLQQVDAKLNQLLMDRPPDNLTPTNIHCQTANITYQNSLNKADVHKTYNNSKNDYSTRIRGDEGSNSYYTHYSSLTEDSQGKGYTERKRAPDLENLGQEYHPPDTLSLDPNRAKSHADQRSPQLGRAGPASDSIPGVPTPDGTSRSSFLQRLLRCFCL